MISDDNPFVLIGCGNMGAALVEGWRAAHISPIVIIDQNEDKLKEFQGDDSIATYASIDGVLNSLNPAAICLATKPDVLSDVLHRLYEQKFDQLPLILSIAAGKPLSFYQERLWPYTPIVRVMPNLSSFVQEGMTACVGNNHVTSTHKSCVFELFDAVGKTLWIDEESKMDALTAVSGSGPAYVFYFIECMMRSAIDLGFSEEDAKLLVNQTCLGAVKMASQSELPISQLRKNVTSPGGTTAAALDQLMSDQPALFAEFIDKALVAAKDRSIALSDD